MLYYQRESDENLVMLTLAGEQNAYEALVVRYQSAAISAALAVTKNRFMAEDAAQDAFVTAWMKLNTLQDQKKFGPWVCKIAGNCARNMVSRYRSFLPLDVVDNLDLDGSHSQNPAELYALSEEREEVGRSVEKLPEKVRQIIRLHYFEGLSIADIADKMRISEGTVKWQLHDGRKRIRKELCAMNEKYSDTLVQRVMKKVEELKLWQIKNSKSGFEKVYAQVLGEVEELPECSEKQHALADVLMRGWWWIPGKKNDALFARIAAAAIEGKNEEVMGFIVAREDSNVYYEAKIEFIRDRQIPRLEKAGFRETLGREWFWLGYELFRAGRAEEGLAAWGKVEELLPKSSVWRAIVPFAKKTENILSGEYSGVSPKYYGLGVSAEEYRRVDNKLRFWGHEGVIVSEMASVDMEVMNIFRNSSRCDGNFFADISVGETFIGTDGTELTFVSNSETVDSPAGSFENCELWETKVWDGNGKFVFRSYYKDGVGIVRHEHSDGNVTDFRLLSGFRVYSGGGLLPWGEGNTWEYVSGYQPDKVKAELSYTVAFADENRTLLICWQNVRRYGYDENSWLDMISRVRSDYCAETEDGRHHISDVSDAIARAEALAVTPMEKAHTKAAASVARRILSTDKEFSPDCSATGHWNFFQKHHVRKRKSGLDICHNWRWCFEWKRMGTMKNAEDPILYNDVLGILQDAANCIWSEEWRIGTTPIVEYTNWGRDVRTQITCEEGGTVSTKAGTFENCFKLCLDIGGMADGWSYRGGKKVYYFADGIGIVRTENEYCGGVKTAVYELTEYSGVGEGFMPMEDGLFRRYEALDLTDGFVGAVEYTYLTDEDGDTVIFADRTGIREILPPVTQYCAIQGEVIEDMLWDEGKWKEGHAKYSANNYHLILHLLARPSRNRGDAKRSVELNGFYMRLMEILGDNGEVPKAWYSLYGWTALVRSAALFGDGRKEEGYECLETAVEYCEKSAAFKRGDLLDVGSWAVFGGVKLDCDNELICLPDGSRDAVSYGYRFKFNANGILYALTAKRGWEWFNSVREEDRFKAFVDRVRRMTIKE